LGIAPQTNCGIDRENDGFGGHGHRRMGFLVLNGGKKFFAGT
jgi:hypothetical protein